MSKVIDLYEFLLEAELHQYYSELKNDLKVNLDNYYLTAVPTCYKCLYIGGNGGALFGFR